MAKYKFRVQFYIVIFKVNGTNLVELEANYMGIPTTIWFIAKDGDQITYLLEQTSSRAVLFSPSGHYQGLLPFGAGRMTLFSFIAHVNSGNKSKAFLFSFTNTMNWFSKRAASQYGLIRHVFYSFAKG